MVGSLCCWSRVSVGVPFVAWIVAGGILVPGSAVLVNDEFPCGFPRLPVHG